MKDNIAIDLLLYFYRVDNRLTRMSFLKNLLFGGVKTSEDPTGITDSGSGNAKASQDIV